MSHKRACLLLDSMTALLGESGERCLGSGDLAVIGLAVGGTGLGIGWDWLTAVGIAPLIVSAAPCLLMCALGLCMMGRGHQANAAKADIAPSESAMRTDLPAS